MIHIGTHSSIAFCARAEIHRWPERREKPKMETAIAKFSFQERDFDLFFMEELSFDVGFFEAFADRIGMAQQPIKAIRHSVYENFDNDAWGETDVLVELQDGTVLLIENKLTANFQPEQAIRYRARAQYHRATGSDALTILIAPAAYLDGIPEGSWDRTCSYGEIADCMLANDARGRWRQSLFREAGNRASCVRRMAGSHSARRSASNELMAFKAAWFKMIKGTSEWCANPQQGATDEFLYAPKENEFNLRIWHHPFAGYLSVYNLEKHPALNEAQLDTLPEGFELRKHPKSIHLDAAAPEIDMSREFSVERVHVEEGMSIARRALDLAESAIARHQLQNAQWTQVSATR